MLLNASKSLQGEFFVFSLRSWNFTEWFLSLKTNVDRSKNHDKRTVGRSWISRNKEAKLSFSRTDRSWVKRRITGKFLVLDFFRYDHERIRLREEDQTIPCAIPHSLVLSRNIETQNWRLENSASWKSANYFATYSMAFVCHIIKKCSMMDKKVFHLLEWTKWTDLSKE